ncbi:ATP-binding protein [Methanoculleus sp. Wushi-C6]|uniref:ATP-binding protein n=1 Tax=Methanoculleus caldifontis TaxID=2651577 RepID=A0ABU3X3U8_9EURY|nr:ATP-binding protein [Methanoculleus sp. Wushi-C6]MDV2482733.1 ATP-binding protein [Methanoculleus sp. Wushi-C6]
MQRTIGRDAGEKIRSLALGFPAVSVIGPRQSGKTTLVRSVFPQLPYALLEDPDTRAFAEEDPRSFLAQYEKTGAIFDEVQRVPELFSYLQGVLDRNQRPGQFILTGSQNFLMMEQISQSLAGRVGIVKLLPLSMGELARAGIEVERYEELLYAGLFPRPYNNDIHPRDFYSSYIQTYLERDLRLLKQVQNLSAFQTFMKMCAYRSGQVVNYSSLANDCGITYNTAKEWLSLLETSMLIVLIRPHHKNFNKRLVKMPKLYFTDPGLAAHLAGVQSADDLGYHPLKGGLFESLVITEFLKYRFNRGKESNLYFWRDKLGHEIDCIIEYGGWDPIPVEIKSGRTASSDFFKEITYWNGLSGNTPERSFVVYGGDRSQQRAAGQLVGYRDLEPILPFLA